MNCHTNNNGVLGNSIDIKVDPCNPAVEIRADVKVEEFNTKRIWGQILNCQNMPVPNTLIKLIKVLNDCNKEYVGIAHTVTDCEGFYQFDVCADECNPVCYKIIVNKAITGAEMVIETGGGNCNACNIMSNPNNGTSSYNPCEMPQQIIVPYMPCDQPYYPSHSCGGNPQPCSQHQSYDRPQPCGQHQSCSCHQQPKCNCKYCSAEGQHYKGYESCSQYQSPKVDCEEKKVMYSKNNYATYTR